MNTNYTQIVESMRPVHTVGENTRIYILSSPPPQVPLLVIQVRYRDLGLCKQEHERETRSQKLRHPHIAATHDTENMGIIKEEVEGGFIYYLYSDLKESFRSLASRKKQEGSFILEADLVDYYQSLALALAFLQRSNAPLRNISPDNVYLSTKGEVKLLDFGYSEVLSLRNTPPEALPFLSPKLGEAVARGAVNVSGVRHDVFKSDVFSLGMTLLHLSLRDPPEMRGIVSRENLDVMLQNLRSFYSEVWCRILEDLLAYEESARPDFCDLERDLPLTKIVSAMTPSKNAESSKTSIYVMDDNINRWGRPIVIKQIKCSSPGDENNVQNEYSFAQEHYHCNICESLELVIEKGSDNEKNAYIVFPKMRGSLKDDIDRRASMGKEGTEQSRHYTEDELRSYLMQLVDVFAALQKRQIAHRDIKPSNILIADDGSLKVCDFGFTKDNVDETPTLSTLLGTLPYISPILRERCVNNSKHLVHNVFKSDVYSLGMTMLHLTALELDELLTDLKNLKERLKKHVEKVKGELREAGTCYSDEWFKLVELMIRFDEDSRPDFLVLKKIMEETSREYDDEVIESAPISSAQLNNPLSMKVEFGLNYARVCENESETVPCLITIEALPIEASQRINNIDVVCLVDESGSMEYENLDIVKNVLHFMINSLTDRDRMCIIGFSNYANKKCPLKTCSEDGKRTLREIVNRIVNQDLTNLVEAFELALKVIADRTQKNHSVRIVILSDGKDSYRDDAKEACLELLSAHSIGRPTVHCLGIGQDVDAELLHALATSGNGEYIPIPDCESIPDTFRKAFLESSRVVARDISISVCPNPSSRVRCKVTKLFSRSGNSKFSIPEISANTITEFLFLMETERQPLSVSTTCPPLKVELRYIDHERTSCHEVITRELKFNKWTGISPQQKSCVCQHWIRAKATERMLIAKSLIKQRRNDEARREISHCLEQIESEKGYTDMPLVQTVIGSLREALGTLNDLSRWDKGGTVKIDTIIIAEDRLRPSLAFEDRGVWTFTTEGSHPLVKKVRRRDPSESRCDGLTYSYLASGKRAEVIRTESSEASLEDKRFEYFAYSDLEKSFQSYVKENYRMPEPKLLQNYRNLIRLFANLQRLDIALYSISPDNIFLTRDDEIRLLDLSYSKLINSRTIKPEAMPYLSPILREACACGDVDVTSKLHDHYKSDVFSFGMIFFHLSLGHLPKMREDSFREDLESNLNDLKKIYSEKWCNILSRLLTYEESERPDFLTLKKELLISTIMREMTYSHMTSKDSLAFQDDGFNRWKKPVLIQQLQCPTHEYSQNLKRDLESVNSHNHFGVCKCLEFETETNPRGQIFAYMVFQKTGKSLRDDIAERAANVANRKTESGNIGYYSKKDLWKIFEQLVRILADFQRLEIAPCNISIYNIFIDANGFLKILNLTAKVNTEDRDSYEVIARFHSRLANDKRLIGEGYDVYKDAVYSVGKVMQCLMALDQDGSFVSDEGLEGDEDTALKAFQQKLQSVEPPYPQFLFDVLRLMLVNKEEDRCSFNDLARMLTNFAYAGHCPEAPLQASTSFHCTSETNSESPLSITTPAPPSHVDVMCVVDESGSMQGDGLYYAKGVLGSTIDKLTEGDRMCIIGFSDDAIVRCPFVQCNKEGKRALRKAVSRITTLDLTNYKKGLEFSLKLLLEERSNHFACILLISDGKETDLPCGEKEECVSMLRSCSIEGLVVHFFATRPDPDANLLKALAKSGCGEYHSVENDKELGSSLACFQDRLKQLWEMPKCLPPPADL